MGLSKKRKQHLAQITVRCSSNEKLYVRENRRGDSTQEGLRDNNGEVLVQLEVKDHSIQPVWKDNAGGYLQGIRGCVSLATEKCKQRRKERWKSQLLQPGQLLICFQPS